VIVVLHRTSGRYLGPGCVLTSRAHAIDFGSVEAARSFLARHGPEPSLVPVALSGSVVAAA
jgi:hypothetical protein